VSGKLALDDDIYLVGANGAVKRTLKDVGIWEEFRTMDTYGTAALAARSEA